MPYDPTTSLKENPKLVADAEAKKEKAKLDKLTKGPISAKQAGKVAPRVHPTVQ